MSWYRATSMLRWGGPKDVYITLRMDLMAGSRESQSHGTPLPSMCELYGRPSYIDLRILISLSPFPEFLSILKGVFDLLLRPLLHPLFEALNTFLCDPFVSNCLCQISSIDNCKAAPVAPIGRNPCAEPPTRVAIPFPPSGLLDKTGIHAEAS